jgi:cell wall-active antibiotic response 4TMS protein YvqF/B-box zinc finger protein
MNCYTHSDAPAVAFCRACGKALCEDCRRVAEGTVYCAEHAPQPGASAPAPDRPYRTTPAVGPTNPGLAFALGLIPGVGAIYNGQYVKGLVHALIFGLMVSILESRAANGLEPLVGILLAAFIVYMAFEARHTAQLRQRGQSVDEFSSVFHNAQGSSSTGAILLIVIGAVFLLNTLDIVEMRQILRFWPVLLIALGVNMLHSRMSDTGGDKS